MLLCRSQLVREDIPVEEYDVRMDYLVTEKGITPCNGYCVCSPRLFALCYRYS